MAAKYKFSWLHFTDLHVGMTGLSYLYPNVEEILFDDLSKQYKKSGPWDAIFFTGDLVQKGSEKEFDEFDNKLRRLLDHIKNLGSNPVLLAVPGNHDLVRPDPDGALIAALSSWNTNARIRETFWTKDDSEYRKGVNAALSNWTKWAEHGISIDRLKNYRQGILPGDFSASLELGEISIGVLGLNTTALQLSAGDYQGKLSLHPAQIEPLFPDNGIPTWAKAHNACFLLTHHPIEWLDNDGKDTIRGEIALPGRFALHLCGHLHESTYTQFSEGGAKSRLIIQGRSLFGLEMYENGQTERLHGYSAGAIEFEDSRYLCLWPRASYRQQAGDLKIVPDHSMNVDDEGLLEPRDIGPSPSPLPDEAVVKPTHISKESYLDGWQEITPEFLESRRRKLGDEELELFFNGQEPSWEHALANRSIIPHRDLVQKTLTTLLDAKTPLLVRLFGAGGEGKSISLLQIVVMLVIEGWNVLFHEDDGGLFPHQILNIPETGRWVLVSDNAEQIVPNVLDAVTYAKRNGRNNIHWVLAARDTDWTAAWRNSSYRNEPNWSLLVREWPPKDERSTFFSLSRDEAERVIMAWKNANCLGDLADLADEMRIERLWSAATGTGDINDKTLFGGVLDTRFSAEGLIDHVGKLMQRLRDDDKKIGDRGFTLYDAFIYAAAMDAIDIEGLDLNVIADLAGVERKNRRTQILMPLGFETAGTGSGNVLRTRHPAIARVAISLVETEFQTDLEEIYQDIVGGTIEAHLGGSLFIPNYGKIINCGNILSKKLQNLRIKRDRANQIAIAAADEAEKYEPELIANTTSLSKSYREAGRYSEAKNKMRGSLTRTVSCKDWARRGRAFILELSVVEGSTNVLHGICLSGLAAADIQAFSELTIEHAKLCLSGIGIDCRRMNDLTKDNIYAKGLRAVAVLGSTIHSDNMRYYLRDAQKADELGVDVCDFDTAFIWLQNAVKEAYLAIDDTDLITFMHQLGITDARAIKFQKLKSLLGRLA
ncbi:MAG TPA: metallophosphoesterase [Anaerolineales bacterium]|nr:metallophosphoesterase [Anaerolineales bacterium]